MNKINMNDKFFHGVKWDSDNLYDRLITLKKILKCGYILSPSSQKSGLNNDDKIYLSVYPNGIYSNIYTGNKIASDNAFDMTRRSFYFILDSKLKDDYEITLGVYPNECIINSKIDLYKYLIGIGNCGCDIDHRILTCYYFNKYISNEINIDELIKSISDIFFFTNVSTAISEIQSHITNPLYRNNYLDYSIKKEEKSLIYYGDYYSIKREVEKINSDINFYDNLGYLIDEEREEKVKIMKKRLIINNYSRKEYENCARELYDRIKK